MTTYERIALLVLIAALTFGSFMAHGIASTGASSFTVLATFFATTATGAALGAAGAVMWVVLE